MGLETVEDLRAFCLELSNDRPSPGGGTASAAAGAMAASLLVMVCAITARSKKHAMSAAELKRIGSILESERDNLIRLALSDARAYDAVVDVARDLKHEPRSDAATKRMDDALARAAEVPLNTVSGCLRVLENAVKVAELGLRDASSDVGVAVLLAEAGLMGASKNVRINIEGISNKDLADGLAEKLKLLETEASAHASKAHARLQKS